MSHRGPGIPLNLPRTKDGRAILRRRFVVTLETVLLFAALRARALADPRQFLFEKHLALVFDCGVGCLPLRSVQQIIRVITRVREEFPVAQFNDAIEIRPCLGRQSTECARLIRWTLPTGHPLVTRNELLERRVSAPIRKPSPPGSMPASGSAFRSISSAALPTPRMAASWIGSLSPTSVMTERL